MGGHRVTPRTTFSNLQNLSKGRGDPIERQRRFTEGKALLNFASDLYRWQLSRGRYFAHEHPATATFCCPRCRSS